jgi:hypothetical protein
MLSNSVHRFTLPLLTIQEQVQRQMLDRHIQYINPNKKSIVFWMDYPENFELISKMEQQSDYYSRSKSVLFVLIVYFWDHRSNKRECISHTCVTPDLQKSNEQVGEFSVT